MPNTLTEISPLAVWKLCCHKTGLACVRDSRWRTREKNILRFLYIYIRFEFQVYIRFNVNKTRKSYSNIVTIVARPWMFCTMWLYILYPVRCAGYLYFASAEIWLEQKQGSENQRMLLNQRTDAENRTVAIVGRAYLTQEPSDVSHRASVLGRFTLGQSVAQHDCITFEKEK